MTEEELAKMFNSLHPWSHRSGLTARDWDNYEKVARAVQQTDPRVVEGALQSFMESEGDSPVTDYTDESKLFLLMRVLFDLPESAPVEERHQRKGWINWPLPDANGKVSLAWPISWAHGKPELVASYEGSEGPPYPAVADYRYLKSHYPFRTLDPAQKNV
jgi:hypothetical protein